MVCYIMAILADIKRFNIVIDRLYLVMINTLTEPFKLFIVLSSIKIIEMICLLKFKCYIFSEKPHKH